MAFYTTGDGQVLSDERPYQGPDGTKYPAGWLKGLEPVELTALGLEPYEPPQPTPQELLEQHRATLVCSPLQGKLALGETEWLRVEALLESPETPWAMRQAILSAIEWKRTSQMITELAWVMGYTDEQVDALFEVAMAISV